MRVALAKSKGSRMKKTASNDRVMQVDTYQLHGGGDRIGESGGEECCGEWKVMVMILKYGDDDSGGGGVCIMSAADDLLMFLKGLFVLLGVEAKTMKAAQSNKRDAATCDWAQIRMLGHPRKVRKRVCK